MAKAVGLTILPLEVLEVIVTYLSAADLARCLSVNRTWYNTFSSNIFWKRYCKRNLSNYLSETKCLVEPAFKPPKETPLPVPEKRLEFLLEQHLWQNWDSGRFKKEEIEFDCDDTIAYNIKVSFFDNDHLCLHRTFETEVWNVAENSSSIITIPHCLAEMWEYNVYKIIENYLVVIQCNVVQMYKISLDSKSWSLFKIFFYNKAEEFSSRITADTDVEAMFQEEGISEESDFERIICGQYLVGAYMDEESPLLHVWDLKTGKKVKEDKCEICIGSNSVELKTAKEVTNKVLITYRFSNDSGPPKCSSIIYDLSQMQFVMPSRRDHVGDVLYFDGCLSVIDDNPLNILRHCNPSTHSETNVESTCIPEFVSMVTSIQPLGSNLLISTRKCIYLIDPSQAVIQNLANFIFMEVDYKLDKVEVLFNRYILLHDASYESLKEIRKAGKSLKKILEFPPDSGTYVASNNACSKIVLERANKLIVLNFW